jgi:L-asparaginase
MNMVLSALFEIPNLKGIILETYGLEMLLLKNGLFLSFKKSNKKWNLHVINVTQCSGRKR